MVSIVTSYLSQGHNEIIQLKINGLKKKVILVDVVSDLLDVDLTGTEGTFGVRASVTSVRFPPCERLWTNLFASSTCLTNFKREENKRLVSGLFIAVKASDNRRLLLTPTSEQ